MVIREGYYFHSWQFLPRSRHWVHYSPGIPWNECGLRLSQSQHSNQSPVLLFWPHRSGTRLDLLISVQPTPSVKIGDARSTLWALSDITSGVPQGSVLGPIIFAIYTSRISAIAAAHDVLQQQYADDTQFYIFISGKDHNTKHWSPRVLSLRPTCVLLSQLTCSQPIQIWGSFTGNQPEAEHALNA